MPIHKAFHFCPPYPPWFDIVVAAPIAHFLPILLQFLLTTVRYRYGGDIPNIHGCELRRALKVSMCSGIPLCYHTHVTLQEAEKAIRLPCVKHSSNF